MLHEIWDAVAPHVLETIGALITLLLGWLTMQARARWGIEIEARHRDALHSAMMTGAQLALDGQLSGDAAKRLVMDYVRASVPDAIRALAASDGILMRMAEAKLAAQADRPALVAGLLPFRGRPPEGGSPRPVVGDQRREQRVAVVQRPPLKARHS